MKKLWNNNGMGMVEILLGILAAVMIGAFLGRALVAFRFGF